MPSWPARKCCCSTNRRPASPKPRSSDWRDHPRLKSAGVTVLLIDHHMDFVAGLVDDVFVLDSGRVIFSGDVEGMRRIRCRRGLSGYRGAGTCLRLRPSGELRRGEALRGVSIRARGGRITAILGANGAGKSTLLRAIAGLADLKAGRILVDGRDVTSMPAPRRGLLGLGMRWKVAGYFARSAVEEN